ncbi:PAS domain-containing protein [Rhizobium leguminosarum]
MNLFKRSSNVFPAKVQQFIFENSPDAYFVIANGIIVQCNKAQGNYPRYAAERYLRGRARKTLA